MCLCGNKITNMTSIFCNFDASESGYDSCVYVDNYVDTVDYFSKAPQI